MKNREEQILKLTAENRILKEILEKILGIELIPKMMIGKMK